MNFIPEATYANALLLNVKISIPGVIIARDAYADRLLNYIHNNGITVLPVDKEATTYVVLKDSEK